MLYRVDDSNYVLFAAHGQSSQTGSNLQLKWMETGGQTDFEYFRTLYTEA